MTQVQQPKSRLLQHKNEQSKSMLKHQSYLLDLHDCTIELAKLIADSKVPPKLHSKLVVRL